MKNHYRLFFSSGGTHPNRTGYETFYVSVIESWMKTEAACLGLLQYAIQFVWANMSTVYCSLGCSGYHSYRGGRLFKIYFILFYLMKKCRDINYGSRHNLIGTKGEQLYYD